MRPSMPLPGSASHIKIAVSSGSGDVEGTRAALQERLGLWALAVGLLSSGFYLVNVVTWPLTGQPGTLADMLLHLGTILHLAVSLLFCVVWAVLRRVTLSFTALRVLELALLWTGCTGYAVMGRHVMGGERTLGQALGIYSGLLACTNVLAARAITVPSTASRTFMASTVAMLPLIVSAAFPGNALVIPVYIVSWSGVAIGVATVGSRVIFGLRSEAARSRRLGQYTLEEKIGAGSMGVVYRASHAMLRRPTAIKLLPPDRAGEANLLRFEREVQLTAQLSHPNTVAIYDYGRTPDGVFYYAMEYLDGLNLEELVRQEGPLPPGRVIHLLTQVCRALAEAHGRGLLHRDIKPANIIVTERGGEPDVVKVVDFGLVKAFAADAPAATQSVSMVLAGTPLYMPPEAITAPDTVDPRSDLYAVGAVGYYMLTGRPVFEAATMGQALAHHLGTAPDAPSRHSARPIGPDLDALILHCLAKGMADRPASAQALLQELARCRDASSWMRDEAVAWWKRFRASERQAPAEPTGPGSEAVTVMVDIANR